MKLCILGNGITSLSLASYLVNQGINVDLFFEKKKLLKNASRTIGISKKNLDFFNKNILDINKFVWNIKEIDIFSDNLQSERILNFKKKNHILFSIIKNDKLYELLLSKLKKNKLFTNRVKKNFHIKDYNLVINCDGNSDITKKFFFKKIKKNYNSLGYTVILKHKEIKNNYVASQIFTKNGPLAFLPISTKETSVVYSIKGNKKLNLKNLIKKYNTKYSIKSFSEFGSSQLKSINLRTYYYKNILAFGDLLHRIHPLAGQGFNMSLRDIKNLSKLIKHKLDHGLELDSSICKDFENKTRHKNFLFTTGIDSIYEFFNLESKMKNKFLSRSVQFIGKNKFLNKTLEKIANNGLVI
tara:strand:+ start:1179 stop:2243 length:1065 start_codon:yes stop_codon:yes gene_type:complete